MGHGRIVMKFDFKMADGTRDKKIDLPSESQVIGFGFNPDGHPFFMLFASTKVLGRKHGKDEKKHPVRTQPRVFHFCCEGDEVHHYGVVRYVGSAYSPGDLKVHYCFEAVDAEAKEHG